MFLDVFLPAGACCTGKGMKHNKRKERRKDFLNKNIYKVRRTAVTVVNVDDDDDIMWIK